MTYRDDLLRAAKGMKRMTDEQIANEAHVNRGTVGRVLDGDPRVGLSTLKAVARVLGYEELAPLFEQVKVA